MDEDQTVGVCNRHSGLHQYVPDECVFWSPLGLKAQKVFDEIRTHNQDVVNHPAHYNQGGIEVLDVADAYDLDRYDHNIIKYVLRAKFKGKELSDLKKAQFYLNRKIARMEIGEKVK